MAETSIQRAARISRENKAKREAAEAAAAAAAAEAKKTPAKKDSPSLLDRIRDAFSSEDDIKRIDDAVDAVSQGVKKADKDSKRKRNV